MFNQIWDVVLNVLKSIMNVWSGTMSDLVNLLTTNSSESDTVWSIIKNICNSFSAIGATILIICFLIGVIDSSGTLLDTRKPEHVVKLFVRFLIARIAVTQAPNIMLTIFSWSKDLAVIAAQTGFTLDSKIEIPEEINNAANDLNVIQQVGLGLFGFIGFIVAIVLGIMLILTVYGRIFKIYIYTAISPIPLATFGSTATSKIGKSFLRSYIGICMEAVMMILVCIIFQAVFNDGNGIDLNLFSSGETDAATLVREYLIKVIFHMLLLFTMIKGTDRMVREMMGG